MPDDDSSRNKVKLNARVTPSKKQEWKNALEEGETLSSLVQRAVDKEIRDEYVPVEAVSEVESTQTGSDFDTTGIEDRLDGLQSTLLAVNSKVETALASTDTEGDPESIEDLAVGVVSRHPTHADIPAHIRSSPDYQALDTLQERVAYLIDVQKHDQDLEIDGSVRRFAHDVREPEHLVRQALLHLENETTEDVRSTIVDGTRHWVRF